MPDSVKPVPPRKTLARSPLRSPTVPRCSRQFLLSYRRRRRINTRGFCYTVAPDATGLFPFSRFPRSGYGNAAGISKRKKVIDFMSQYARGVRCDDPPLSPFLDEPQKEMDGAPREN